MKFLRRSTRIILSLAFFGALVLILSCAALIYQSRQTLEQLTHPNQHPAGTDVFSTWLILDPAHPVTDLALSDWLSALQYESVPGTPLRPGQFSRSQGDFVVYARPFAYPDRAFPLQLLKLRFAGHRLAAVENAAGAQKLESWRLEPKQLAEWAEAERQLRPAIRLSELPPHVPQAIIAMEDKRFYQHGAIDLLGILRALWVDLRFGRLRQGASTLSQQLARSVFLDVNRTLKRKALEAALAFYLEARFTKAQLLEMYLNQVYWGQDGSDNLLGIESASHSYFGKPARQLTVSEAALLAGILQSPNRYSPRAVLQIAVERRNRVLALMRAQGFIDEAAFRDAAAAPVKLARGNRKANDAAYFLAALHDQIAERYAVPAVLGQGWKIFTTLDPTLQPFAARALTRLPRLDAARSKTMPAEGPQAALIALDPASGAVRAWMGGTNFTTNPFDHAANARRQPGSAFKPFVVLAALESRRATTATFLEDKPITLKAEQGHWTPQNYDRKYRGKVSIWDTLVYSLNVPAVRLAMETGLPAVVDVAHRAGIESPLRPVPSLALGTSEVSVVELTGAYATLANGGRRMAPYVVEAIVDGHGVAIESHRPEPVEAFRPNAVFLVTQMLQAVMTAGTARQSTALGVSGPVAGKTGTSENYQDAWFMGYTPNLVCGVWVGYDRPRSLGRSAAGIALPVWVSFMKAALSREPAPEFEAPKDLTWKTIDLDSGMLVRSGCTNRWDAAFLPGTEPTQTCTLHPGGIVGFFRRLTGSKPH